LAFCSFRITNTYFVVHSDNWEMPPLQCHVFHSSSLCHSYIRTVTERTATDILCAVKCWMITLRHNKPTTALKHFIAPHITTNCVRLYSIHIFFQENLLLRLPPASTKLRCTSFHRCWRTELWTPNTWILIIQTDYEKTYCWFFGYKLLNGNEIFDLSSLNFSVPFSPSHHKCYNKKENWIFIDPTFVFWSYLHDLFENFFILWKLLRDTYWRQNLHTSLWKIDVILFRYQQSLFLSAHSKILNHHIFMLLGPGFV
jgi:hypothetical protein